MIGRKIVFANGMEIEFNGKTGEKYVSMPQFESFAKHFLGINDDETKKELNRLAEKELERHIK